MKETAKRAALATLVVGGIVVLALALPAVMFSAKDAKTG